MQCGVDFQDFGSLFELVDDDGEGVRYFVVSELDGFFADDFAGEESFRLIGNLIVGEKGRTLGQLLHDFFEEVVAAVAPKRGNGHESGEWKRLRENSEERQQLGLGDAIYFIECEDSFAFEAFGLFKEQLVGLRERVTGVEHQQKDVDTFEGGGDFAHHLAIQCGVAFVQAGRIDENDLAFGARDDALDAIAGGLRLGSDNGNFLANETV